jgi:hypothetical protein
MPEKKEKEKLIYFVNVRTTLSEKKRLQEDAEIAGLGVSELIRRRYFGKKKVIASANLAFLRELRRQGGLLKHIHNQSGGMYSSETATALRAINLMFESVASDS